MIQPDHTPQTDSLLLLHTNEQCDRLLKTAASLIKWQLLGNNWHVLL